MTNDIMAANVYALATAIDECVNVQLLLDYRDALRRFKNDVRNKNVKWVELRCFCANDSRSGLLEYHSNEVEDG